MVCSLVLGESEWQKLWSTFQVNNRFNHLRGGFVPSNTMVSCPARAAEVHGQELMTSVPSEYMGDIEDRFNGLLASLSNLLLTQSSFSTARQVKVADVHDSYC